MPERQKLKGDENAKNNWWQYQRLRKELYDKIEGNENVIVLAQTAKYILPIIIKGYNNTPHGGLNGIKPNEVFTDEEKRNQVLHLNTEKSRHSNTASKSVQSDLKKDDKVRVRDTAMFKKGTESRWTDEIFTVESTKGKSVTLTDGRSLKREDVLPIPKHTIPITHINIVKLATKERKQVIQLHQEGVDQSNIINQPRQRKSINYKG